MLLTMLVAAALFGGMVAILALGYQQMEREKEQRSAAVLASAPAAKPGRCMLCDAPLRRMTTRDEVVFEIERRIDTELQDISHLLRTEPETFHRIYQAEA